MNRGDVWWFHHPHRKPRPVCILTRSEGIPHLRELLVVPATTRIRGVGAEVELDAADGLPQDCVLNLDQVQIARKAYLTDPITTLTSKRMHEVCEALAFATGC